MLIHPDFLLIVLSNRPGFPFLGNDFFRACGDVFHVLVVDNPGIDSEIALLTAYFDSYKEKFAQSSRSFFGSNGQDEDEDEEERKKKLDLIERLARAFAALRDANQSDELSYPFSAREAVAVVKHIAAFPANSGESVCNLSLHFFLILYYLSTYQLLSIL